MKKVFLFLSILGLSAIASGQKKNATYDITKYGAKADGRTLNTQAIQKAIDDASANGGGKVLIPAGYFLTAQLFLKSNVELCVSDGATLLGSTNPLHYEKSKGAALIVTNDQTNVSIKGKGTIDGQGRDFIVNLYQLLTDGVLQDSKWRIKRPEEAVRPMVLLFSGSKNISVKGVTIKDASSWVTTYRKCDGVLIDSIRIESVAYWNNDGIDIVDSKNVRITNSFVNSADDGICLKSEDANDNCENIYVANCTIRSSANAFKLGTGSRGGFKKVTVRNLTVYNTFRSAIALETVDGATLEDIDIQNVTATYTGNAIFIRLGHRDETAPVGKLRNVYIANVKAEIPLGKPDVGYPVEGPKLPYPHNVFPSSITGLPGHPVENVTLENIEINYVGGLRDANVRYGLDSLAKVTENKTGYPEFSMFGELPAWGFYVRHANGIKMRNVKLTIKDTDYRAACIFDDVRNLELKQMQIPVAPAFPVIVMNDVKQYSINEMKLPGEKEQAIRRQGYTN